MIKSKLLFKIFTFNEDSFLNNHTVKVVNYILLILCVLVLYSLIDKVKNDVWILDPSMVLNFIVIAVPIVSVIIPIVVYLKFNSVEFYEWDFTERKKKGRVNVCLIFITTLFSLILAGSLFLIINFPLIYVYGHFNLFSTILNWIIPIHLLFNLIKSYELHYFLFGNDLKQSYKIQKKPGGWMEDGKEVNPEDEIKEIMRRDFGSL